MPSGYVSVAKRLVRDELTAVPFSNPVLTQRRLAVMSHAGRQLDPRAEECLQWIIADLKRTSSELRGS